MLPIVHFEIHCPGDRRISGKVDNICRIVIVLVLMSAMNSPVRSLDHMAPWHVDPVSEERIFEALRAGLSLVSKQQTELFRR